MIKFAEHAAFTGWNDITLYSEFHLGLAEHIKDQLLNFDRPRNLEQLKIDALKCDNRYWERQHEKAPTSSLTRTRPTTGSMSSAQQNKPTSEPCQAQSDGSNLAHKDLGNILGADGKLTEAEKEHRRAKNLCLYCGQLLDQHGKDCQLHNKTPHASG